MSKVDGLELYALAERLHRQFLDVVQIELDRSGIRDVNGVRAMIMYNIGDNEMTVSELTWRGCYLGTNVSYNLKKMTETGYLQNVRSSHDRRVVMVRNSDKGKQICALIKDMNSRHVDDMARLDLPDADFAGCRRILQDVEQFWARLAEPRASSPSTGMAA
jgi:DNA-binding MarR family transcriptional regulator